MAHMRAMDAAFLAMERAGEPRHLGAVMIFDPGPDGPLTPRVVREVVIQRLGRMPSARRVVVDSPLGLGRPTWKEVRPDLDVHLRHAVVAPGDDGGMSALAEHVATAHARRLNRRRPLWELHVVEGLGDGRVALYAKIHLAAIDDTTGVELMTGLLDGDAAGSAVIEPVDAIGEPADVYERFVGPVPDQLRRAAGFPFRLANRAMRAMGEQMPGLTETAAEIARRTPGLDVVTRLASVASGEPTVDEHPTGRAPACRSTPRSGRRARVGLATLATDDIRAVSRDTGASFNEVVVAACSGALRGWLEANDELPTSPVVAIVPVLVADADGSGSHIAALTLALPTNLADPAQRLARSRDVLAAAKRRRATVPASLQQDVAMFAPPIVAAATARLLDALRTAGSSARPSTSRSTNVPGPRQPVFLAGRPLRGGHPVLSVTDLTPLHIGIQPGPELTGIGAIACRDHVIELASLVDAVPDELAALRMTSRAAPRSAILRGRVRSPGVSRGERFVRRACDGGPRRSRRQWFLSRIPRPHTGGTTMTSSPHTTARKRLARLAALGALGATLAVGTAVGKADAAGTTGAYNGGNVSCISAGSSFGNGINLKAGPPAVRAFNYTQYADSQTVTMQPVVWRWDGSKWVEAVFGQVLKATATESAQPATWYHTSTNANWGNGTQTFALPPANHYRIAYKINWYYSSPVSGNPATLSGSQYVWANGYSLSSPMGGPLGAVTECTT